MDGERRLLEQMGMEVSQANGGCCGLAGSWGFETGKHDISMACGEQGFLPAVRSASGETVVVANGFSCKTQLQQSGIRRRALHAAQVMKLAREHRPAGYTAGRPEDGYYGVKPEAPADVKRARAAALIASGAIVAGTVAAAVARRSG
jgi:hypothetical protein